ncbi:hypothetical protein [Propionivibrio sp.]|uniref:hypothetical protein n=1 Tax=Propionivibrio sp. TaxID=2212460 RepID=UPI0039E57429
MKRTAPAFISGELKIYRGPLSSGDMKAGFVAETPVKARLLTALALTKAADTKTLREVFYRY